MALRRWLPVDVVAAAAAVGAADETCWPSCGSPRPRGAKPSPAAADRSRSRRSGEARGDDDARTLVTTTWRGGHRRSCRRVTSGSAGRWPPAGGRSRRPGWRRGGEAGRRPRAAARGGLPRRRPWPAGVARSVEPPRRDGRTAACRSAACRDAVSICWRATTRSSSADRSWSPIFGDAT